MWDENVKIPIKDLYLWNQNARFPEEYFNKTEKELIAYFLNDDKIKIEHLAKEIVADFNEVPQFELLLVLNIDGRAVVLEGNRRLTIYKLLANPQLTDDLKFQNLFNTLRNQIDIDDSFAINTHVTDDEEQALRFVDRKHNKGNNEVSWTSTERDHFSLRRNQGGNKAIFKVEMTKRIKLLELPPNIISAVLGKGYETTLWRILEKNTVKDKLGCYLENSQLIIIDDDMFYKVLKVIVYNVFNKEDFDGNKLDSRSLNKADQIDEYAESIFASDIYQSRPQSEFLGN